MKRTGNAIASEATRVSILRNFPTVKTLLRNHLVRGVVQAMYHQTCRGTGANGSVAARSATLAARREAARNLTPLPNHRMQHESAHGSASASSSSLSSSASSGFVLASVFSGIQESGISGFQNFRISGFQDGGVLGFQAPGFQYLRLPGFHSRLSGFQD